MKEASMLSCKGQHSAATWTCKISTMFLKHPKVFPYALACWCLGHEKKKNMWFDIRSNHCCWLIVKTRMCISFNCGLFAICSCEIIFFSYHLLLFSFSQEATVSSPSSNPGKSNPWQNYHLCSQQHLPWGWFTFLGDLWSWPGFRLFLHSTCPEWARCTDHILYCSRTGSTGGVSGIHEACAAVSLSPDITLPTTSAPSRGHQNHERGRIISCKCRHVKQNIYITVYVVGYTIPYLSNRDVEIAHSEQSCCIKATLTSIFSFTKS